MKKIMKVIGTAILAIILLIAFLFVKAALTPAVPRNYTEKTSTGGDIEAKYLAFGNHEVRYTEVKTDEAFKKYEIYYPAELTESSKQYPLVVFANGTGIPGSKYKTLFRHLASWGFIVAGNEDDSSGDGISTDLTLAYLLDENDNPDSLFYQKIDISNIGLSGHSQGGAGVLSAATITAHKDCWKTIVALSPANEELAHNLGWNYVLEDIHVPVFLIAGTEGDFEMETVIPTGKMTDMYSRIRAPKVMARRKNAEHGDMLYQADGYVTAWFMYYLQNDQSASAAFTGDHPELQNNELYQEQAAELTQPDEYAYTFNPHVMSDEYRLLYGEGIEEEFYTFCDAVRNRDTSFPCPSKERFHQLLYISNSCFPPAQELIDKEMTTVEEGICHLSYRYDEETMRGMLMAFEEKVTNVIRTAVPYDEPDSIKAMELFTAVARKDSYDYSYTLADSLNVRSYRAIMEDAGICQEIAAEYVYYLLQSGINAIPCSALNSDQSEAHEWALVKLEENYYHMDPTYATEYPDSLYFFGMDDIQRAYYGDFPQENFTYAASDQLTGCDASARTFESVWLAETYAIDHSSGTIRITEKDTGKQYVYAFAKLQ